MKNSGVNIQRLSWYMICTGLAIAMPCNTSCTDLLLLRMHFDYALFGIIKSCMFFLPPFVYFFAADFIRRSGHNAAVCRWGYLVRILLPLLLPLAALLTESPVIRLCTWVAVLSLSYTAAMFANNTLFALYQETIVSRKFNRYSLFFSTLISVPSLLLDIPILFWLGNGSFSDKEFLVYFFLLEGATALCYIPAFAVLRNFAMLRRRITVSRQSFMEKFKVFADRSYRPILCLATLRAVWMGLIISYWTIYLITACKWNIGYISVLETLLFIVLMFCSKPLGKIADTQGYRFCFCLMLFIMIGTAGVKFLFQPALWATILFCIVIYNTTSGIVSGLHCSLCGSASFALARPGYKENYLAISSLCTSIGCFAGSCLGSVLLKAICGNADPCASDYELYFALSNLLLIPQLYYARLLKSGDKIRR